ncbi:MAG: LysM peptidoglycan-binding domain-containing protein [Candidatus Melainabacteria bacterium]|nr:MAG: LysM peptidoglycan-binding domain-containing protein [Candidatus Melainabacteria bacterium]
MNRQFDSYQNEDSKPDGAGNGRHCRKDSGGHSSDNTDHCKDSHVKNWHPDYSLSSPHAREWHKQNEKSKHQSIETKDGVYTVKHGDALSTIAARELKAEGKSANKSSIAHEVKEIVALNHEKYKDLDCNKEYLAAGWKLKMPHHKSGGGHTGEHPDPDKKRDSQPGPPRELPPPQSQQPPPLPPERAGLQPPPQVPPQGYERQGAPQFDQSQIPMQILGQALRGLTGGMGGGMGGFGSPDYGQQYPGDRMTFRLAQDLLQGNVQDCVQVLRAEIARGNGIGAIQQANQIAEQSAAQQGMRSPLRIAIERDGDVDIVDQYGRRIAQAGNVYGRQNYDGWQQSPYLQQQQYFQQQQYLQQQQQQYLQQQQLLRQQQYMQQQHPYSNWRSGYGVSGGAVAMIPDRSVQIQQDMFNVNPEHRWHPNMNNARGWGDRFDDPGMTQALNNLQRHGLAGIFGKR